MKLVLSLNGQETFGTVEMIAFAFTFLTPSRGITVISSDGGRDDSPFFFFFFFAFLLGNYLLHRAQRTSFILILGYWLMQKSTIRKVLKF